MRAGRHKQGAWSRSLGSRVVDRGDQQRALRFIILEHLLTWRRKPMTLHHRGLLGTPCRPAAGLDPAPVEARRASYASRSRHGGSLRTSRAIRCNHRRDQYTEPQARREAVNSRSYGPKAGVNIFCCEDELATELAAIVLELHLVYSRWGIRLPGGMSPPMRHNLAARVLLAVSV